MSMQAQSGDGGIAPTHLQTGLGGGWQAPGYGCFTPGKTQYPFYRRLGGPQDGSGRHRKSHPTRIQSPDHPAQSKSLYCLHYP